MSSSQNTRTPTYFSLLPSEICRLILGYLLHNGHRTAAHFLFTSSNELDELRTQYSRLCDLPMHLTQITLLDLIKDYLQIANFVAHQYTPLSLPPCQLGSIAPLLTHLLKNNVPGVARVPALRSIRPVWLPTGKSYLPPRVITQDWLTGPNTAMLSGNNNNNSSSSVCLPLVAVPPHVYSSSSSVSASKANTILSGTVPAIPLLPTGPGTRPIIRLVRQGTQLTSAASVVVNPLESTTSVIDSSELKWEPRVASKSTATSPVHKGSSPSESPGPLQIIVDDPPNGSRNPHPMTKVTESSLVGIETAAHDLRQSDLSAKQVPSSNQQSPSDALSPEPQSPTPACQIKRKSTSMEQAAPSSSNDTNTPTKTPSSAQSPVVETTGTTTGANFISPMNSPFTVFSHLPPASEVKRLSVGSDSGFREETLALTTGPSRRRRLQTPRHVVSSQSDASGLLGCSESQDDVDIQRFLSALFSKPEHLATQINAKLNRLNMPTYPHTESDYPCNSLVDLGSANPVTSLNQSIPDSATTQDRNDALSDAHPVPFIDKVTTSDSAEEVTVNPLLDLLENDLESCIDQLLSQFDVNMIESDEVVQQPVNEPINPPIEVIDLMLPSGASTPAYPTCLSAPNLWVPGAETSDHTASLTVTTSVSNTPHSVPHPRKTCSPPLCLSQLARDVDESPRKRRRLNDPGGCEPVDQIDQSVSGAQLQTPNFKQVNAEQILHTEVPGHALFTSGDQLFMYDDCVRFGTSQMASCTTVSSNAHPDIRQSYLEVLPFADTASHNPGAWDGPNDMTFYPTAMPTSTSQLNSNSLAWPACFTGRPIESDALQSTVHERISQECKLITLCRVLNRSTTSTNSVVEDPYTHVPAPPTREEKVSTVPTTSVSVGGQIEFSAQVSTSVPASSHLNSQPVTTGFAEQFTPMQPVWSSSKPFVLQGLPLISPGRNFGQPSMATFVFVRSVAPPSGTTATATMSGESVLELNTTQPRWHANLTPLSCLIYSNPQSLTNSVIFSLPQGGGIPWKASAGSTVLLPINVDLDSPNPYRLSAMQSTGADTVASVVSGFSAASSHVIQSNPITNTAISQNTSFANSSIASVVDKENRPSTPFAAPLSVPQLHQPVSNFRIAPFDEGYPDVGYISLFAHAFLFTTFHFQKNSRRKVLNLATIDVDQILSKSHCE
ncbi:hypothetical protein FGIG_08108 [Fasciola gigantica]|uniref:Uncharacterized protein n=1 Tax=Fasciola gigantica TaxID=46835 RepID=A0A504YGB0_FASGI|nr:hypothetical protein FGIG_08108 [Fasciola gigantica]